MKVEKAAAAPRLLCSLRGKCCCVRGGFWNSVKAAAAKLTKVATSTVANAHAKNP